jgi:hypothetical protein
LTLSPGTDFTHHQTFHFHWNILSEITDRGFQVGSVDLKMNAKRVLENADSNVTVGHFSPVLAGRGRGITPLATVRGKNAGVGPRYAQFPVF